jgi:hypothetical protein
LIISKQNKAMTVYIAAIWVCSQNGHYRTLRLATGKNFNKLACLTNQGSPVWYLGGAISQVIDIAGKKL